MNIEWILSFLFVVVLILMACMFFYQKRSLLSPSVLFATWLSISLLISLFFLPKANYYSGAFLWYVICLFVFYIGESLGSTLAGTLNFKQQSIQKIHSNLNYLSRVAMISSIIGSMSVFVLMGTYGTSFFSLFDVEKLISISRDYSLKRYEDPSYRTPTSVLILIVFMYLGNLIGGYIFALSNNYTKICLGTLIPNILVGLILTTRAAIFLGVILWTSAFLSAKVASHHGKVDFLNLKKIFVSIILTLGGIILLGISRTLRSGKIDNFNTDYFMMVTGKLFSIIFASIPSFSMWFKSHINGALSDLTYGAITFGGFLSIFGIKKQKFGSVDIGGGYPETTIHSIFGALAKDFTLYGTLLFFLIFGASAGYIFKLARNGSFKASILLVPIYLYLLGFLVNSPWKFNNINLAILLFLLLFLGLKEKGIQGFKTGNR
ncbi:O-antigen polymerase [Colwellia sp. C1TZA3]|uniref:O-antigen polymerase n=1 Tax=Colwellia sp. C1TZA3 TaxID=2508879 RepID=UPI0011B990D5|nr:O-antigen polymerase [Colwellia sp. C1TZA3]TWX72953.1 oligosaccharide repeat unit polymerase [Colwellia sp. C1TZA3]